MATAKPAASPDAALAAHIRIMNAAFVTLAADLGRGSAYGPWQALLQAGANREDIELVHAWLREHQAASPAAGAT